MAHYSDGACYSVGATQQISIRSTSVVRACGGGGDALVDATVRSIVVEDGRAVGVRVSSTSALGGCQTDDDLKNVPEVEIRAKRAVVWASGIYNLYNKILPQDLEPVRAFHDPSKRSVKPSNGHVFLFCKIRGDAADIGLPKHNLWYFNSYDMDEAFDSYFANPQETRPPTVYIGFPCTKDVTWKKRFPGVSNCIMISDGLWEWFEKWENRTTVRHRGPDYDKFKQVLTDKLLEILYETVPQARGKVEYYHLGTPLSEVTYLSSYHGGSYGTKCLTSMLDETNERWTTNPRTEIPGLYLAGSDAFLPAVCGAMYGGCFGASAVLGPLRTVKLALAFISDFAQSIRDDNPKLTRFQAYCQAWYKFVNE
jgi:all-trans-retinol 13,14-reductase